MNLCYHACHKQALAGFVYVSLCNDPVHPSKDVVVENIDVNGAEMAFVTFANGEKLWYGPIGENDDELVAMVRSAAARFGLSERRFDAAQPELDLRLPDGNRLSAVMRS